MSRQFIYHMRGLSKTYPGGKQVLNNIHLSFYPDAKIGVLGVNGAGKSTLLKIMAGFDKEWTGEAWVAEGARVGYLPQEPKLDENLTVRENVMLGVAPQKAILDRYNELAMNYSDETADEMTNLQDEIEAKGLWDLDSKVDQAMDALRCPGDDVAVATLSGGERRRVALCRLLLWQPELLLLDEPTNHLDAETVGWLEGHLRSYPGAILIVTHDRYFLDNVRAGSSSSIAAGASRTRATTRPGWSRSRSASPRRAARRNRASAPSSASRNGSRPRRRPARPSPRPVSPATRNSSRSRRRRGPRPPRSSSRSPSGSATTSSSSTTWRRPSATGC